jgi:hypothetical protein
MIPGSSMAAAEKPNIIVIFTDDHGYADLSCVGTEKDVKTPHEPLDEPLGPGLNLKLNYCLFDCSPVSLYLPILGECAFFNNRSCLLTAAPLPIDSVRAIWRVWSPLKSFRA